MLGDRYRLGSLIGSGAMCEVFRAVDLRRGECVAIKLFRAGGDDVAAARLRREAALLARMSHPGLVRIFDIASEQGRPYLVMQLVDGRTLREELWSGPLHRAPALYLAARLTDALAYVHAHRVIHRDIKPSNVLLSTDGGVFLADFGVARALDGTRLTGTGQFLGSAAYLAPEQLSDELVTVAADVYSLGLVLLECLTGQTEYTGTTAEAALARLNRPPRVEPDLGEPWCSVLPAMTERHPDDRPTAAECAADLGRHLPEEDALVPLSSA